MTIENDFLQTNINRAFGVARNTHNNILTFLSIQATQWNENKGGININLYLTVRKGGRRFSLVTMYLKNEKQKNSETIIQESVK